VIAATVITFHTFFYAYINPLNIVKKRQLIINAKNFKMPWHFITLFYLSAIKGISLLGQCFEIILKEMSRKTRTNWLQPISG
jgi:hypothetical protein